MNAASLPGRPGFTISQRSHISDEAREQSLDRDVAGATTPEALAAAWDAVDAYEEERAAEAEEQANQLSREEEIR